ncbi:MAG: PilZ domain-containing protein [Pseudomonadota bacterium]|nr:MAG: PilZ domain-containing protein [Pseudomonadota bacterium]
MEHRYGKREPLAIDAIAECGSFHRRRVCIRDVSIGGMFVELPTAGLKPNMTIRLCFLVTFKRRRRRHRIQGVIVRVADTGVALTFDYLPVAAQVSLLALLRDAAAKASA